MISGLIPSQTSTFKLQSNFSRLVTTSAFNQLLKDQVRSLRNKLELENSAKKLGEFIENNLGGKDTFDNPAAYTKLVETAHAYIKSGGATDTAFLDYLKSNPHLKDVKWNKSSVEAKVNKAFSDAMKNMDPKVLSENDPLYLEEYETVTIGEEPFNSGGEKELFEIDGHPDVCINSHNHEPKGRI